MSLKDGLSLGWREEQGNTVSEILGVLDGHLDRSWIVSMGDTRHDDDVFCLDKLLRNCRGVYAFTVERGGSIGRRLCLDSHNNLPRELLIEEPLPYPQLYSATAVRRHYPQPRPRQGIVRQKTKSTQRQQEQKEDFAALRRPKRNREIYEYYT